MAAVEVEQGRVRAEYEQVLRVIGAYLDAQVAYSIRIIEVINGFQIQYGTKEHELGVQTAGFTHEELAARFKRQQRRGKRVARGGASVAGDDGYENVLRALGHEVDQVGGSYILVDEVDNVLWITYQFLDPGHGYMLRKRMATLGPDEMTVMLDAAYARRAPLKRRLMLWAG